MVHINSLLTYIVFDGEMFSGSVVYVAAEAKKKLIKNQNKIYILYKSAKVYMQVNRAADFLFRLRAGRTFA